MKAQNGLLKENEKQANRIVAKVMRITFVIFTLIYILNVIGIFTVDMDTLQDDNFLEFNDVIIFGVIPRALVLVAVSAIFTMLCGRTATMLSNLLGAEEQKEMLHRMEKMKENQKRMDDATTCMNQMYNSTNECKEIISTLGEEFKEIIGIVQTITSISSQTNILALNATIEEARAGENGKGFAVVAEEIQKLSEQTKTAVENIGSIVRQVVKNTDAAVEAMEENVAFTQNGMESIQKANKSTALITSSNQEFVEQIHAIDETAQIIQEKSGEISSGMKKISDNTQQNCNAVEQVTAATQENSAGTESLAEIVEQIKSLSEQLNQVVQG